SATSPSSDILWAVPELLLCRLAAHGVMSQEVHTLNEELRDHRSANARVRLGDGPCDQLVDLDDLERREIEFFLFVDRQEDGFADVEDKGILILSDLARRRREGEAPDHVALDLSLAHNGNRDRVDLHDLRLLARICFGVRCTAG